MKSIKLDIGCTTRLVTARAMTPRDIGFNRLDWPKGLKVTIKRESRDVYLFSYLHKGLSVESRQSWGTLPANLFTRSHPATNIFEDCVPSVMGENSVNTVL